MTQKQNPFFVAIVQSYEPAHENEEPCNLLRIIVKTSKSISNWTDKIKAKNIRTFCVYTLR